MRDRANLALGYAYLQNNQPALAKPVLQRVRLDGPFSNKALLGVGWADAAEGQFQEALTPWMELRDRNLLDSAVQEAYLAIPYAFAKLNANAQAAENYELAIQSFDSETVNLDASIAEINDGTMLDKLLQARCKRSLRLVLAAAGGAGRGAVPLPVSPARRPRFPGRPEELSRPRVPRRHARALAGQHRRLRRHARHARARICRTRAAGRRGAGFGPSRQIRRGSRARRRPARPGRSGAGRGRARHRGRARPVGAHRTAGSGAARRAQDDETNAIREKTRLAKGVLYWRLAESFKARVWNERRTLKDLDQALREAQNRWVRVQKARGSMPNNTGDSPARVEALRQRLEAAQVRLADVAKQQNGLLEQLARNELEQQKERIGTYQIQARFALASIYDRAALGGGTVAAPAARRHRIARRSRAVPADAGG